MITAADTSFDLERQLTPATAWPFTICTATRHVAGSTIADACEIDVTTAALAGPVHIARSGKNPCHHISMFHDQIGLPGWRHGQENNSNYLSN